MEQVQAKTFDTNDGQQTLKKENKNKGAVKEFIAKLSKGLMLPIAILPIAGLFLGIGATIGSYYTGDTVGGIIGKLISMPGNIIFGALPVLFAVAIAISFTKDAGAAGLSALVGWLVFNGVQSAFIITAGSGHTHFLWYNFNADEYRAIFANNIGIPSLSTSVFGGICIGLTVAFLYNKFKNITLPNLLGFFSGIRFIPIVTFGGTFVLGLLFSMVWPIIGMGLFYLGMGLGKMGQYGGVNSLIYGFFNRALVPFGLHHCINVPLWFTSVGETFPAGNEAAINGSLVVSGGNHISWAALVGEKNADPVFGDINVGIFLTRLVGHKVMLENGSTVTLTFANIMQSINHAAGMSNIEPGQYTNGPYTVTLFALPAAALAMLFTAEQGSGKKMAFSIVVSAAFVSFLTGITEPIEFTFLFLIPWLFWGFHAVMAGVGGMICTILGYYAPSVGPHVGFAFASGFMDFTIYGLLPDIRGGGSNCWMLLLIALAMAPAYFFVFTWAIKKFDVATPGRGGNVKLFTKKDYLDAKAKANSTDTKQENKEKATAIILAYGGIDNIKNVDACITKLRVQINDATKVDQDKLKELGAMGVMRPSQQSVYAVFGTQADIIKNAMNELIDESTRNPDLRKGLVK